MNIPPYEILVGDPAKVALLLLAYQSAPGRRTWVARLCSPSGSPAVVAIPLPVGPRLDGLVPDPFPALGGVFAIKLEPASGPLEAAVVSGSWPARSPVGVAVKGELVARVNDLAKLGFAVLILASSGGGESAAAAWSAPMEAWLPYPPEGGAPGLAFVQGAVGLPRAELRRGAASMPRFADPAWPQSSDEAPRMPAGFAGLQPGRSAIMVALQPGRPAGC